jgi:hypothetical protein
MGQSRGMSALDDPSRLRELYLPPADHFVLVDVPDLQFAMIEGEGDHDGEAFRRGTRWLFTTIGPIKAVAKERMGKRFVEAPLECLWWADDMADFVAGNRDRWKWRQMIVTADWVDQEMFGRAVSAASERLGEPPSTLRLERFTEGTSAQIMHIGPEDEEAVNTMARLHEEFLPEHDLVAIGYHHEIYLSDPKRVPPDKLRTVLRQPVADKAAVGRAESQR